MEARATEGGQGRHQPAHLPYALHVTARLLMQSISPTMFVTSAGHLPALRTKWHGQLTRHHVLYCTVHASPPKHRTLAASHPPNSPVSSPPLRRRKPTPTTPIASKLSDY
ncbi:hypothetical protein CCHR01_17735 [Colletotrichum chrysophilum]|uniref:Uncharacterized protein n=1 Tax=Colletotrichum chrysophilum TaxID=1836956 RepID=A0AAD9A1W9_9PEZI|nr:hypothetical protein CCHR01_17735 [Colletotrichum chrysophilum]